MREKEGSSAAKISKARRKQATRRTRRCEVRRVRPASGAVAACARQQAPGMGWVGLGVYVQKRGELCSHEPLLRALTCGKCDHKQTGNSDQREQAIPTSACVFSAGTKTGISDQHFRPQVPAAATTTASLLALSSYGPLLPFAQRTPHPTQPMPGLCCRAHAATAPP